MVIAGEAAPGKSFTRSGVVTRPRPGARFRVMSDSSALAPVSSVSREEFDEFLNLFSHELRNRLNVLSLETADLAEQWEGTVDLSPLQERIRECTALLREVRALRLPGEEETSGNSLAEMIERLRRLSSRR